MDSKNRLAGKKIYTFPYRPWMNEVGAAAAAGEGNKGLKGIVAG